jgi:hypothetical protein
VDADNVLHRQQLEDDRSSAGIVVAAGRYGSTSNIIVERGCFAFGKLFWRSTKLHINDGAASSSAEEVTCHIFLVVIAVVPKAGDGGWCQD